MPNANKAIRRLIGTVCFVTMLWMSVIGQTPQTTPASKFTSKDGKFSVKIPGEPTAKNEDITSENGPTTLHTFILETNEGKNFFIVGYSDYKTTLDVAKSLEGVISAQANGTKGKITSDKAI